MNAAHLKNTVATFIKAGNTTLAKINVDSICKFQGFKPADFAHEHARQMTTLSLQPSEEVTDE